MPQSKLLIARDMYDVNSISGRVATGRQPQNLRMRAKEVQEISYDQYQMNGGSFSSLKPSRTRRNDTYIRQQCVFVTRNTTFTDDEHVRYVFKC